MKITDIRMRDPSGFKDGLGTIVMERLGDIVIVAGPNGSGKSRLLERIVSEARSLDAAQSAGISISGAKQWVGLNGAGYVNPRFVRLVPRRTELDDWRQLSRLDLLKRGDPFGRPSQDPVVWTLPYLQVTLDKYMEASHPASGMNELEKKRVIARYACLQELIQRFLGTSLDRSNDGEAMLFGLPISNSRLSEGQRILLQFCADFSVSKSTTSWEDDASDAIVVMDEPESHLHPGALLQVVDHIRGQLTNGQLWIATHSVALLAHFPAESLWWMEHGSVRYAGNAPQHVLRGLLGSVEHVDKLLDFLSVPAALAGNRFAFQSLCVPTVVGARTSDPQVKQVQSMATSSEGRRVRILDFGAGRGRLVACMGESAIAERRQVKDLWDYVAFDKDSHNGSACGNAIVRAYGTAAGRYFNDATELMSCYDAGSFDFVVMCNVLHEIDPLDWIGLFDRHALVSTMLRESGSLLIIEDGELPIGEKPRLNGFTVLDTLQLRLLFQIRETDVGFSCVSSEDGRLKAHRIPKSCIHRVTAQSRREALMSLCKQAKEQILELRCAEPTYQNGRRHAFWLHQLVDAQFSLDQVG